MDESQIFAQALKRATPAERAAYLDEACAGRPQQRSEVEALLRADARDPGFLEQPPFTLENTADFALDATDEPAVDTEMVDDLSFLAPPNRQDSLGRLGHYEVLQVIGRGGMGVVLRAFDANLHRVVAIKVMGRALAASATARKRFIREARAAAAVSHDHIVTIHAVEEIGGLPYLVMSYIDGQSLQQRLDRTGPLQTKEVLRIGMQTAAGLSAAHAQGLVHRDVKPANILLENGVERVKLTDFGLARAGNDASLTQQGMVAGTPSYMAPEQARCEALDHRADLFSLGSVLYAMCTGRAPFRGQTSLGVLKRVCEEVPRPIREANPEIPECLVAVIAKLHTKDPADRYQSAAEVAEVLGRHLAELQEPSKPATAAAPPLPVRRPASARKRGRWALAAAVILLAAGLLVATESTGLTDVTKFVATVLRIRTPDGNLIVEVNDPEVKVTIEGDGGLSIAGAGPQEVRLAPGKYKVLARKEGQPEQTEVVTITRGHTQVVKVSFEPATRPPGQSPPSESALTRGQFVVLSAAGTAERKFDALADAVSGAGAGDTIEIRANGPIITSRLSIAVDGLTIRAAAGFVPVVQLQSDDSSGVLISNSVGRLVLEGLELRLAGFKPTATGGGPRIVNCSGSGQIYIANCLLHVSDVGWTIRLEGGRSLVQVRNSMVYGSIWFDGKSLVAENSACCNRQGPVCGSTLEIGEVRSLQFQRCTLVGSSIIEFLDGIRGTVPEEEPPLLRCEVANCVLDGRVCVLSYVPWARILGGPPALPAEARSEILLAAFKRRVIWQAEHNAYPANVSLLGRPESVVPARRIKTLADWSAYWEIAEEDAVQGLVKFQAGDVRNAVGPTSLAFRLMPGSPGSGTSDGKDLGPDLDLVGPGAAYERWKKTPEYQEWLKESGQVRAKAAKAEAQAFVVLGGAGVAERKFDTLADAVMGSSDGDTIEIRGNGPFVTDPIEFKHTLTVRSSAGFSPVLLAAPRDEYPWGNLFLAHSPLRLEGLEVRAHSTAYRILEARRPLWVASCRFVTDGGVCIEGGSACVVRNSEMMSRTGASLVLSCRSQETSVVTNNLLIGQVNLWEFDVARGATFRFTGNTFVSPFCNVFLHLMSEQQARSTDPLENRVNFFAAGNVISCGSGPYGFVQDDKPRPNLSASDAEAWVRRRVNWQEKDNCYQVKLGAWIQIRSEDVVQTTSHKSLADWNQFWGLKDTGSSESVLRFHGGDLIAKALADATKLSLEDIRLRPDSAGYRAGPNGKDLGADVDVVGPGPAYERWKKTAEFQEWLKETGQEE